MKSFRTITSAGFLASALVLAGCGGGSDDSDMMPDPPPEPTPQEMCADAGNNWYEGACYTDQELVDLGVMQGKEEEAEDRAEEERQEEERIAREAMIATAAKLYAGISAPTSTDGDTADTDTATGTRYAAHGSTDTSNDAANANDIEVAIGAAADVFLSEDKEAMVAALEGWKGKKYMASGTSVEGMYEAVVYSNVGEPTQGAKFNSGTDGVGFATSEGVLTIAANAENDPTRISSPSFDHQAGYKTFDLPDPNPGGAQMVTISGSYYGVAGTYACNPTVDADGCRVNRAENGYTLALTGIGGGAWTFTANDPEQRVTEMPDANYASYGWWIHKSADDKTYTASAFADDKGEVPAAAGVTALMGTATYSGGAAGKYALSSSTGGTNDAGHFTATATLEANFNDDKVTGTIDQFMGADGMSRNWSVELMSQDISDNGSINGTDGNGAGGASMTKWAIDGTAGDAAGQWTGGLMDNGDDGVPQVATGTFYSTYDRGGSMVGAFGATNN